jgi:hypothetical protein
MKQPTPPNLDLDCEIPVTADGYYSDEQSIINPSRKDHFLFVMDLPPALKDSVAKEDRLCHSGSLERLEFSIWGAVIPDISVPKLDITFGGQSWAWSSHSRPSYGTINCNFTVDNRYDNYFILWKWLNIQNQSIEGDHVDFMKEYSSKISIFPLDEYKKPIAEFVYHDAFITNIGGITKSTRDAAETESTFSFDFSQLEMHLI